MRDKILALIYKGSEFDGTDYFGLRGVRNLVVDNMLYTYDVTVPHRANCTNVETLYKEGQPFGIKLYLDKGNKHFEISQTNESSYWLFYRKNRKVVKDESVFYLNDLIDYIHNELKDQKTDKPKKVAKKSVWMLFEDREQGHYGSRWGISTIIGIYSTEEKALARNKGYYYLIKEIELDSDVDFDNPYKT